MPTDVNTLLEHFEELRGRLIRIIVSIMVVSIISFSFGIKKITYGGLTFYFLHPELFISKNNITSQIFTFIKNGLLPPKVDLIVTGPGEAIISLIYISLFLGVFFSMPIIVRELNAFISPGLYPHEKKLISKLIIPSSLLFAGGCIFAYISVIPFCLNFLYLYAAGLQAITFITIDNFISFIVLFMIGFGIAFQLPIIMITLSSVELVEPKFWLNNFKYAFVALAIFGAIITPDGSGVTMWFVTLPMLVLYLGGYLVAKRYKINLKTTAVDMHLLSPNVRGLLISLIFGTIILGFSMFFYELKVLPIEAITVGALLMLTYIISLVESWRERLWGYIVAAGACIIGIYIAIQDPALAMFLFKDGVITPLLLADLFFIVTQVSALYFSATSILRRIFLDRSAGILVYGGELYE